MKGNAVTDFVIASLMLAGLIFIGKGIYLISFPVLRYILFGLYFLIVGILINHVKPGKTVS